LDDRKGENDEVSRGVREAVKTKAGKIRVAKVKGRRSKRGDRKETRGKSKKRKRQ